MERRAWRNSLRDIRTYVFIFTIFSLSSIVSLINPQPVSAEGFLGKTVRCAAGGLFGSDCRTPAAEPVVTPAPAEPQPASPSATTNSPSTSQAQPTPRGQSTTEAGQITPISNIELAATPELQTLPTVTYRTPIKNEFITLAMANSNVYSPGSATLGASTSAFEPSREGWKVMGISWYWWGIALGAIVGSGAWVKRRRQAAFELAE